MLSTPIWLINTLLKGKPSFETLKPYMSSNLSLKQLGKFMDATFSGALNKEKISRLRDLWKGNIIIKGLESLEDIKISEKLGLDGVIISNHGGRQIDIGESTVNSLKRIKRNYNGKMSIKLSRGNIRGWVFFTASLNCVNFISKSLSIHTNSVIAV